MSKYLLLLILSGSIPVILSFYPPLKFYRNRRALSYAIIMIVFIFGGWDVLAAYRGHWYFNPQGVLSFRLLDLPLEEILFFIVIPFCCIFTWEVIKYIKERLR